MYHLKSSFVWLGVAIREAGLIEVFAGWLGLKRIAEPTQLWERMRFANKKLIK